MVTESMFHLVLESRFLIIIDLYCFPLYLGLEKQYGVIIPDAELGQKVFRSVRTIAQYVVDNRALG